MSILYGFVRRSFMWIPVYTSWRMHALSILSSILMTFQRLNNIIKKRIMTLIIYEKNLRSFYYKLLRIQRIIRRMLVNILLTHINMMINLFKTLHIIWMFCKTNYISKQRILTKTALNSYVLMLKEKFIEKINVILMSLQCIINMWIIWLTWKRMLIKLQIERSERILD